MAELTNELKSANEHIQLLSKLTDSKKDDAEMLYVIFAFIS